MHKYELVVLFQVSGGESSLQKSCTKIRDVLSGLDIPVVEEIDMGRRSLSYEIKKQKECFYRLFRLSFDSTSEKLVSLNRSLGIAGDVIRHMLVKQEGEWGALSSSVTGHAPKSNFAPSVDAGTVEAVIPVEDFVEDKEKDVEEKDVFPEL